MHSGDVSKWRDYFKSSNSSIFDVIENAILVAALDHPCEFRFRKEQIAFKLLTCNLLKCSICEGDMSNFSRNIASSSARESKVNCSKSLHSEEKLKAKEDHFTRMSDELGAKMVHDKRQAEMAEAKIYEENYLILEIEEGNQTLQEAMEIKKVLGNNHFQDDLVIEELLQKLQGMDISIQILKATMIGATVTALRKHESKHIRQQVRDLVSKWRKLVDDWIESQDTNSCDLPQPHLPNSICNEENPHTPTFSPVNLSKLFEDVDEKQFFSILPHDDAFAAMEDFNIEQDSSERLKLMGNEKELKLLNSHKKAQLHQSIDPGKRIASESDRKGKGVVGAQIQLKEKKIERPSSFNSQKRTQKQEIGDLGKRVKSDQNYQLKRNTINKPQVALPLKANVEHQPKQNIAKTRLFSNHKRAQLSQSGEQKKKVAIQKPKQSHQEKPKRSEDADEELKLERSRAKLKARYEEFENAKKRRAVQLIDPKDLRGLKRKYQKKHHI
ncbi:hypothetical protein V2J09_024006 [Rumex salicifolius]